MLKWLLLLLLLLLLKKKLAECDVVERVPVEAQEDGDARRRREHSGDAAWRGWWCGAARRRFLDKIERTRRIEAVEFGVKGERCWRPRWLRCASLMQQVLLLHNAVAGVRVARTIGLWLDHAHELDVNELLVDGQAGRRSVLAEMIVALLLLLMMMMMMRTGE